MARSEPEIPRRAWLYLLLLPAAMLGGALQLLFRRLPIATDNSTCAVYKESHRVRPDRTLSKRDVPSMA